MSAAFFAQLKDLALRVAELEKQLAETQRDLSDARQRLVVLEVKRGPGRPPNQVAA